MDYLRNAAHAIGMDAETLFAFIAAQKQGVVAEDLSDDDLVKMCELVRVSIKVSGEGFKADVQAALAQ